MSTIDEILQQVPVVAILRGLQPERAIDVASVLIECGIRLIEVPLNSPSPFLSIQRMCQHHQGKAIFGAGTVFNTEEIDRLVDIGARLVVSPHTDAHLIQHSLQREMIPVPGFYTPTEAIQALHAGATYLKLFPANQQIYSATRAILPKTAKVIAVGGIDRESVRTWQDVVGFGVGSALFRPSDSLDEIHNKAIRFVQATQREEDAKNL